MPERTNYGLEISQRIVPVELSGVGGEGGGERGGGGFLRDESFSCHGRCFKGVERKKEKKLF